MMKKIKEEITSTPQPRKDSTTTRGYQSNAQKGKNGYGDEMRTTYSEDGKRNKRSVWTINTKPYKEAHFAVFPPKIPELCIKAGSKERGM
jgi:DNA modification methylase